MRSSQRAENAPGFTLVELLAVLAIIVAMFALVVPAINGVKGGNDLTKSAFEIQGILDQARAYAMANNTYSYVGFFEEDPTAAVTTPAQTGVGRLVVAVVASKDGTRGYNIASSSLTSPAWTNYNNGANLVPIGKLQRFENAHLAPLWSTLPSTGGLATRPSVSSGSYQIGNTTASPKPADCVTPFSWPIGSAPGAGKYDFATVINFDPQGAARIQYPTNQDFLIRNMEIGLLPARGNSSSTTSVSNCAALQIDGITGATHIYRP